MGHPLNSAGFAGWCAARTPVRQWAGWPSLERRAPAVAGSRSACTGTARHSGSPGTSHGLRARTDHTSHSFPASGHPAALRPSSRADVGGEPTDPAHALSGRFGMVAELVRHPAGAATDAEMPYGEGDCLRHRFGGPGVRWLQPGGEQCLAPRVPDVKPVDPPAGRDLHAYAIHRGRGVTVAVFGGFVESYQGIHARHVRPARPWPASAARRNLPTAATDFRLAGRSRGGAASAGWAMPRGGWRCARPTPHAPPADSARAASQLLSSRPVSGSSGSVLSALPASAVPQGTQAIHSSDESPSRTLTRAEQAGRQV